MPKILVADDNANIQKMVVLAFEERGIQVTTVANGEAAVRRVPDLMPDLILADIFMPVRNGYEVCEFVKKDERFSHIPVILLVGAFDPLDEKEARRVSADGVLKKPFVPPDPLIAMVMSALEKNPKVVAELAKAKEAKEAKENAPVDLAPSPAIPARPEPKPLPDFPEPSTPEEAALVYGFGRNVRGLDSQSAKAPISELDDETDEEFDGASTARDWRRDAMDFEVPTESANKPAFSSVEDFEPVKFPTENEFPPRRVRIHAEPTAQESAPAESAAIAEPKDHHEPAAQEEPVSAMGIEAQAEAASTAISEAPSQPALTAEFAEESAHPVQETAQETVPQTVQEVEAAQLQPEEQAETVPANISDSSEPANVPHWMDALAPSASTRGGWMETLAEQSQEIKSRETQALETKETSSRVEESFVAAEPSPSTLESVEAHAEASAEAVAVVDEPETSPASPNASIDEPLPVEQSAASEAAAQETMAEQPVIAVRAPEESWFAPAPPVFERVYDTVSAPVAVAASEPDRSLELDHSEREPVVAFKDPGLVEPTAVRVTAEPLLVDEDAPRGPSDYGVHPQQLTPLHSFFTPAVMDTASEAPAASDESRQPPVESAPFVVEKEERIPTGPPPNLEALSAIPFLTPPPGFDPNASEPAPTNGAIDIDDVVRKVLAKLEPQLHDLLSGGLKPLVENLLHNEINKKEE